MDTILLIAMILTGIVSATDQIKGKPPTWFGFWTMFTCASAWTIGYFLK